MPSLESRIELLQKGFEDMGRWPIVITGFLTLCALLAVPVLKNDPSEAQEYDGSIRI